MWDVAVGVPDVVVGGPGSDVALARADDVSVVSRDSIGENVLEVATE